MKYTLESLTPNQLWTLKFLAGEVSYHTKIYNGLPNKYYKLLEGMGLIHLHPQPHEGVLSRWEATEAGRALLLPPANRVRIITRRKCV